MAAAAEPAARFLLAWMVPAWILFELVVTKLPHYVLPLYPAIAILIARAVERRALSQNAHLVTLQRALADLRRHPAGRGVHRV